MKYLAMIRSVALGYSHGTTETINVKIGKGKDVVRINAEDFDEKTMKKVDAADAPADAGTGAASDVNVTHQGQGGEVVTTAAPSAPNFGSPDAAPLPIDPVKNAAAPVGTTSDQLIVMKSTKGSTKGKFVVADGTGVAVTGDHAKRLGIDENGYDTVEMANDVISTTEPKPAV